jgi:hypothetical protein
VKAPHRHGALPNLIVIGAMKCGTTSLHHYLDLHPEISMSRPKELNFFLANVSWGTWSRGLEWYARHFSIEAPVRGESSINYTNVPLSSGTAERMHRVIPGAKLIYMVRDPLERAVSHYIHARAAGREPRPISEALGDLESRYVKRSLYYLQIEEYLRYYPPSRIHVEPQESLMNRRAETMSRIFAFLDVDPSFHSARFARLWEVSRGKDRKFTLAYRAARQLGTEVWGRFPTTWRWLGEQVALFPIGRGVPRPVLDEPLRERLRDHFRGDVRCLRELTGQSFAEWSL